VPPEQCLDVSTFAGADGVELGDDFPSTDDREVLTSVLYGVEDVGEVPSRVSSANLWDAIRLSDHRATTAATSPFASPAFASD
jgi:hypothetical protein